MASPLPHVAGSATSADAAEMALPRAGTDRALVLEAIRRAGWRGLTDEEIVAATGLNPSTARPRRWELAGKPSRGKEPPPWALIRPSGTRPVRPGSRLQAVVWVSADLVDEGGQLRLGGMQ